ncbi:MULTISPECIES: alkaline phosphatase [Shewanella]|uniref:Alkaline phosphatase n=2 Tax=Shewanella TaxID=22 RepID=A0A220UIE0_9GAMM|nr:MULTISPECIES: alkaline phosphatase [Shewanella]QXN25595.1 alkaline phosphatase [Shewanella putrefaciens]ABI40435.1 Alkaline phosphatase [Shewanella sp. MR-4]ASK67927.1 alkaline phosphatase [Shewanella bicestrii]MCL1119793.1 alkaline phosphatase [Shewanella seohaensis]PWF63974.1 alkaline phosphatase [Shewanella sp. BC20]
MNKKLLVLAISAMLGLAACGSDGDNGAAGTPGSNGSNGSNGSDGKDWTAVNQWYVDAQARVTKADGLSVNNDVGAAKNVILFVGDGMGVSTITAARILEGQLKGKTGEENSLSFETLPYVGLSKTYNVDGQTPDSAGTMSAMMTGVKTDVGVISQAEGVVRANCASTKDQNLVTSLELAAMAGMSTGVVTTARLTHATPAATYAHVPERDWEADSNLPAEAVTNGCKDIAAQMLDFNYGNGLNVMMGGGRRSFIPKTLIDPEGKAGKRNDGRDLTAEWLAKYTNAAYVQDRDGFLNVDVASTDHLLGLFNSSHMEYDYDRTEAGVKGEPSLAEMTAKSIDILKKNTKGYVLIVEAGRIDHAHHAGNAARALYDTVALSEAVRVAMEKTSANDTLLMVTADHSHVFTIAGYPTRGNPILGLVKSNDANGIAEVTNSTDANGLPYTTVGYANGMGYASLATGGDERYNFPVDAGRKDLNFVDTQDVGFHQEALVPLSDETHAGEDVAIFARGPSSDLVQGTVEQNHIFHVMNRAANLVAKAEAAMAAK